MRGRTKTPEKEQQILQAAAEIFAVRDFHEVLMDDVAAQAGVGKGTLYRYFPNKDDLYFATIFSGMEGLRAEIDSHAQREATLGETLEAIASGLLRTFWARRPLLTLIHHYEHRLRGPQGAQWLERRTAIAGAIGDIFRAAARRGETHDVNPQLAAELFLGMVRSANVYRSDRDTPEGLGRSVASILLDGLRNGKSNPR